MSDQKVIDKAREQWLDTAGQLTTDLFKRKAAQERLCPSYVREPSELAEARREVAKLDQSITRLTAGLEVIESETAIGARALLGDSKLPPPVRCALVLLVAGRLNRCVAVDCETIGELIEVAAGPRPAEALLVRNAFRVHGGVLRPHVLTKPASVLDEYAVVLSEQAFDACLSQGGSQEPGMLPEVVEVTCQRPGAWRHS